MFVTFNINNLSIRKIYRTFLEVIVRYDMLGRQEKNMLLGAF